MTADNDENDMTKQMSDVLSRLETRLDDMEKGEKPDFLKDKDEKGDKDDKKKEADEDTTEVTKTEEYSDIITSDYLNWMERRSRYIGCSCTL